MIVAVTGRHHLPQPLDSRSFTTAEASDIGVSASRLRASDLSAPFHGVRSHKDRTAMTLEERVAAYLPLLGPGRFFSHTTAAELYGMRMPTGFHEDVLHVSTIAPSRAPRAKGVVGHQWSTPPEIWSRDRLRVTSPMDTWIGLGGVLPVDDLIVMADGLLRRKEPAADAEALRARVVGWNRLHGAAALLSALDTARAGTDSAPETRLRLLLARAGFPEPEVNGVISTRIGRLHGDLVFRSHGVVVEYDGEQHRTDSRQFGIDVDRLDAISAAHWRVIRVDKRLLRRADELIARVGEALRG